MVRIREAHLINVVLPLDDRRAGSGRGQRKDTVGVVLRRSGLARLGGNRTQRDLHAPVLQGIVCVDRFLRVVLVVLILEFKLDRAALGVDLIHRDLRAVLRRVAVNRRAAGQRAGAAELKCRAGRSVFRAAGAAVICRIAVPAIAAAAGQHGSAHGRRKKQAECLFHVDFLPNFWCRLLSTPGIHLSAFCNLLVLYTHCRKMCNVFCAFQTFWHYHNSFFQNTRTFRHSARTQSTKCTRICTPTRFLPFQTISPLPAKMSLWQLPDFRVRLSVPRMRTKAGPPCGKTRLYKSAFMPARADRWIRA